MNLNLLIVLGLVACVVFLVYFVLKTLSPGALSQNISQLGKPGKGVSRGVSSFDNSKKNLSSDIDFLNKKNANIVKVNTIVDNEQNMYQYIDLGDGKILIMKDAIFIPQDEDEAFANEILNNSTELEPDDDGANFESQDEDMTTNILSANEIDIENMKAIINGSQSELNFDYSADQESLFNIAVNEPQILSSNEEELEEEEETSNSNEAEHEQLENEDSDDFS